MELRHFRYFLAAAEELNISKASRRLNVSQPAMSHLIRDFEDELGTELFVRERFGLALTPAGLKLMIYARQIIDLCNEAVRTLQNQPASAKTIKIGFISSSLGSYLGTVLKSFRESNPDVMITIHELSPANQLKALQNGQIDLALIGNPWCAVHDGFNTRVLFKKRLEGVLPDNHRLAKRKQISLKELECDDFIGYREESFPGRNQTIINACSLAGFIPNLRYQTDSLEEVMALISSGVGVCLMPADSVNLSHPDVTFVSIKEKLEPVHFTAAWRRDDFRSIITSLLNHTKHQKPL